MKPSELRGKELLLNISNETITLTFMIAITALIAWVTGLFIWWVGVVVFGVVALTIIINVLIVAFTLLYSGFVLVPIHIWTFFKVNESFVVKEASIDLIQVASY